MKKWEVASWFLLSVFSILVLTGTAQAVDSGQGIGPKLKEPAPQLSSDGRSMTMAIPRLVVVTDPRPERQGLAAEGLTAAFAAASPEEAVSTFSINFIPAGSSDPFGQLCDAFPTDAQTALQAAAAIWSNKVESSVPITITACWANLGSPSILGYSGASPILRDFAGAKRSSTWYGSALANSLAGFQILPGSTDMSITFNSGFSWYLGTDGHPPAGLYDMVTVATHEICHGLNFAGSANYSGGQGSFGYGTGYPNIYDTFIQSGSGTQLITYPNPSTALGSLLTSNDLWFNGPNADAANGGSRVKIFAPSSWTGGSSYSHLDYATFAGTINSLMVYAIGSGSANHDPGPVTLGLLQDLGWSISPPITYSISGTVLDGSTSGPALSGATVAIAGKTTTTSSTGAFTIAGIEAGSYTMTISKSGFVTKTITDYAVSADQTGLVFFLSANMDTTPPTVTEFTIPGTSNSLTVPILALNAIDDVGVTGYLVNESPTKPAASSTAWTAGKPASYTFASAGNKTLYAWAKDAAGNVSNSLAATVTITLPDTTPPIVTEFTIPSTSSSLTIPITALNATDDVAVTGYLVNESAAKPSPSDPGWRSSKPTSYTFTSSGNKTLYAWAKDAAGNVSTSRSATVTITGGLPSLWFTQDIGNVGVPGSTSLLNGIFTLKGSGFDIWGTTDAFRFAYKTMTGDGTIIARVASLQNTNPYAKGGLMIRQSLTANSTHAMMDITPGIGAEFSRRTSTGGTTTATVRSGIAAPYWVKLVRSGNTFTGYVSANGTDWTQVGSSTIYMSTSVYVGLIVNSHNNGTLCTATFDQVSTPGLDLTPPTVTAFSIPSASTSPTVPITTLTATDNVGVTGYLVNESATKPSPSDPAWSASKPASYTFASSGKKTLYAWAKDAAGNVSNSLSSTVTVSSPLPAPWFTQDIGNVAVAGSASFLNGTFTLKGSGYDIWGTSDAFRFAYKTMTGDGTIVARVASLQNTNPYAKGGVMIRQSLTANSMHAMVDITPGIGAEFSRRTSTGGTTTATVRSGITAPYWVKLVRSGNIFTGYISGNGTNWVQLGSSTINMNGIVYIGLLVNSHHDDALCTTNIDHVQ